MFVVFDRISGFRQDCCFRSKVFFALNKVGGWGCDPRGECGSMFCSSRYIFFQNSPKPGVPLIK